jgi:hypothetical protein
MCSSHHLLLAIALVMTSSLSAQDLADSPRRQSAEISGVLLVNAYYNDDLVNSREVPWLASPRNPIIGERLEALGSTVRQSRVMLSGWASDVLGGTVKGELDLDFFGTRTESSREPVPRIRRAVGTVRWSHAWLIFGQEALPISPFDPSSYSTVGVPGFTGAGNLSRWMPQVRLGMLVGSTLRIGMEAAAVAPRFDSMADEDTPQPDRAELTKRPFVQGRVLTRWGSDATGGEVSFGGHYGWFTSGIDSLGMTHAGTASARFFVTSIVEIRGEAFVGEGLGMLGGGGIDQTLSPDGTPVRTKGGWAQLNLHPAHNIELGGGYGMEDPENDDLDPAAGRSFNVTFELHCHLYAAPLVLAVEYRRLETTYSDAIYDLQTANHLNLALGFEF